MAVELVINTVDQHPAVSALYESCIQRGDVICWKPEGWQWSTLERAHPDWVIVIADITEIEADALIESGRPGEPQYRNRLGINPDGLASGARLSRDDLQARVF